MALLQFALEETEAATGKEPLHSLATIQLGILFDLLLVPMKGTPDFEGVRLSGLMLRFYDAQAILVPQPRCSVVRTVCVSDFLKLLPVEHLASAVKRGHPFLLLFVFLTWCLCNGASRISWCDQANQCRKRKR